MRRRRRAAGTRRRTDWIPYIDDSVTVAGTVERFALIDTTDLVDKDGFLTVERVVGEVMMSPIDLGGGATTIGCVWYGIILSEVDNTGGITAWSAVNPLDADAPWLWRRCVHQGAVAGIALGYDQPNIHFDVNVRRKMNERQDLLLVMNVTPSPFLAISAPDGFNAVINVRTLVKLA